MMPHHPLTDLNTLRLVAHAEFFCAPATLDELEAARAWAKQKRLPVTLLGEGSNVVLVDDVPGLVIKLQLKGTEVLLDKPDYVLLSVAAGEHFDDVIAWSLAQGYQGLENLSLIPGSAGAAPFQNIGAYGVELADRLVWVEAVQLTNGQVRRFSKDDCNFAYRDSIFKSRVPGAFAITRLCLRLKKQQNSPLLDLHYADVRMHFEALPPEQQQAAGVREIICAIRRAKLPDPDQLPNAGSFFKNPVVSRELAQQLEQRFGTLPAHPVGEDKAKLAAGWLIEKAGFKGVRQGPVSMHQHQALVLVNHGGATAREVQALAEQVRQTVHQQFGVLLEQEPQNLPGQRSSFG